VFDNNEKDVIKEGEKAGEKLKELGFL